MFSLKEISTNLNNEGVHRQCIVKIYKGKQIINNDYKKYQPSIKENLGYKLNLHG
tara:strand:- start:682 stop:846 length:165 start_codon:yes stop_codon:yes gene_type:complete